MGIKWGRQNGKGRESQRADQYGVSRTVAASDHRRPRMSKAAPTSDVNGPGRESAPMRCPQRSKHARTVLRIAAFVTPRATHESRAASLEARNCIALFPRKMTENCNEGDAEVSMRMICRNWMPWPSAPVAHPLSCIRDDRVTILALTRDDRLHSISRSVEVRVQPSAWHGPPSLAVRAKSGAERLSRVLSPGDGWLLALSSFPQREPDW
eukprot:scaffold2172_cov130-Isochrysis_galbana.AAC.4